MRVSLLKRRLAVIACALLVGVSEGCTNEGELQEIVDRKGTRSDIVQLLGPNYILYEKGTPSWSTVETFTYRRDPELAKRFAAATTKYPKVMYYTTTWVMTWVFLDDKDQVREFYRASQ